MWPIKKVLLHYSELLVCFYKRLLVLSALDTFQEMNKKNMLTIAIMITKKLLVCFYKRLLVLSALDTFQEINKKNMLTIAITITKTSLWFYIAYISQSKNLNFQTHKIDMKFGGRQTYFTLSQINNVYLFF